MESETIGKIVLIPPKGILSKLRETILSKFNGGEIRYAKDIELPPARFDVELFVDDDCEVCPYAVELLAELSSRFNVHGKIYNLAYTEPPKDLAITATPVFRINSVVRFTGIPLPLDTPQARSFIEEKFREAYIRSHPKLHELTERLRAYAEAHGYRRNPNDVAYMNLIYKLLLNIDRYGYPFCPCRPLKRVEGATPQQIAELNKDKICPCIYAPTDIAKMGHCICGMFWSKEKVEEYVRQRLEKYGWMIKEIEDAQKILEEAKKRIVSGRMREAIETAINILQNVYASTPD